MNDIRHALSPAFPGITAVLLAAGEGRRFDPTGRRLKLLEALPDGRPVLRAACEALLPYVGEIVVVAGARAQAVQAALDGLPLRHVVCADAASGMSASIRCGVGATEPSAGWLVALADMPFVGGHTIAEVGRALTSTNAMTRGRPTAAGDSQAQFTDASTPEEQATAAPPLIVRPFYQSQPGHPVGFAASLRPELLRLEGEDGARQLIKRHASRLRRIDVADEGCIRDIDVASDLSSLYSG